VLALELYTIYNEADGDTLSEVARELLHVDHPVGAAAWTLGWGGFSYWFWRHILDEDSVWCLDKRRPTGGRG
jgi:hypothetical protein